MYEQELSRFFGFQVVVALMLFWVAVAHPCQIRRLWAFYASVVLMIVSYAAPTLFAAWFPLSSRWASRLPMIFITLSLVLAFVAVGPRRDRTPPRVTV
jgi:hypothetical protein